jgi:hypothetical protein
MIVPTGELEIYLANGWRLADEPNCSGARMLRPGAFTSPVDFSDRVALADAAHGGSKS